MRGSDLAPLQTLRLQLIPYTTEQLLALIDGVPEFDKRMGLKGPSDDDGMVEIAYVWRWERGKEVT